MKIIVIILWLFCLFNEFELYKKFLLNSLPLMKINIFWKNEDTIAGNETNNGNNIYNNIDDENFLRGQS